MLSSKPAFCSDVIKNFILLISSIILFALPQPNFIIKTGIPFTAFFSYIPLFILARRSTWKSVWIYGLAYGIGSYCFFTSWLAAFHPMGIAVISFLYGIYLLFTVPLLKAASVLFGKKGWLVQWLVWCGYEYVKTLGFSGFHYGVTAYSQWQNVLLRQCTDVVGIWGLSALIVFPSAWISGVIQNYSEKRKLLDGKIIPAALWVFVFTAALLYGVFVQKDYSNSPSVTAALIQQNSDPWKGGTEAYRRDLKTLQTLSDQALAHNSEIDFVVWPETAFIPRIEYHYQHRKDRERFDLVNDMLSYIDSKNVPFIIGNDHAEEGYNIHGEYGLLDYNTVCVFTPGKNVIPPRAEKYFKMHLVPFTEHFPFSKVFPKIYELLLNGDTHMWEPGRIPVIFETAGVKFGTPICFEDTFAYIGRRFVQNGAQLIVNLSNDAWSKSAACQYQHLSMAVFRSVENRVPSVRATASGQTCIIDPNGRITAMAQEFTETYLIGSIPVIENIKPTLYTKYGDVVGLFFAVFAAAVLAAGAAGSIFRIIKINSNQEKHNGK